MGRSFVFLCIALYTVVLASSASVVEAGVNPVVVEMNTTVPFQTEVCQEAASYTADGTFIPASGCSQIEVVHRNNINSFIDGAGNLYRNTCVNEPSNASRGFVYNPCTVVPTGQAASVPPGVFTPPSPPPEPNISGGGGSNPISDTGNDQLAPRGGIVPACPVGEPGCANAYEPSNYGSCEVIELGNNLIRFFIGLLSVFAAIIFVYSGILLVISQGNPGQIQKAKSLFINTLIGLLIALAAYAIVSTIMGVLVGNTAVFSDLGKIDCSYSNRSGTAVYTPPKMNIDTKGLTIEQINAMTGDHQLQGAGEVITYSDGSTYTIGSAGGDTLGGGGSLPISGGGAGACDPQLVSRVWGNSLAGAAQCIISKESACGASPISRSDIGADGNPFSFGAMQINTSVHIVRGCTHLGIPDLNCLNAWNGRNYSARVSNPGLFNACRAALLNNECNMINGRRIYAEAGNRWRPWSTASACGLR